MNISKLIELVPGEEEIKNIKSKHRRISAYVEAARCLTILKDKGAEKFIGISLTAVDELPEREINKRPVYYARSAESYSIIGSEKTIPAVEDAVSEIMKIKPASSVHNYDKIILPIARAGVNTGDIKIVDTARKLCDRIHGTDHIIPALCGLAECYAYLGKTKKAMELADTAMNEVSEEHSHEEGLLVYFTGIVGDAVIKVGEINNSTEIIMNAINLIEIVDIHDKLTQLRSIRIFFPAINALIKITGVHELEILINLYRNPKDNHINDNREMIECDITGLYAFDITLNEARMLYLIGEKEKAIELLKLMEEYLFGEEWEIYLNRNAMVAEMALLWENMNKEKTREIINKIYNELKDMDADYRVGALSEILSSIQKPKLNQN